VLSLVFGLTYTNLSIYLRFGVCLFVETFRDDPLARVSIPSVEGIKSFEEAFAVQHPPLTDFWATMDGDVSRLETSEVALCPLLP
jgi:hypothetical protein